MKHDESAIWEFLIKSNISDLVSQLSSSYQESLRFSNYHNLCCLKYKLFKAWRLLK